MRQIYERCAGMDVHKKSVTVCVITPEETETKTFLTMTRSIEALADWLASLGIKDIAMESTGSYWKPIYNLLELRDFEITLVNARHVKTVPGRKTDVKDAEWLAQLMQHGLLTGSFVPTREQRELRELTRYRRTLIDERADEVNRLQKVLEGGNIKLGDVASDVMGKSGRTMLKAIVAGETNPETLASFALGRMKGKEEQLKEALYGTLNEHQSMMLKMQLDHIEYLDRMIEKLDQEVAERLRPLDELIDRLDEIPGVGRRSAEEILAEIGIDMSRFPTDRHLASWAGMSPGNNESAGKRKSGRTPHGNPHLRRTLVQCAHSAAKTRNTYLGAQFKSISSRRGGKRAAVAVGHSILTVIYHMIKNRTQYEDPGSNFLDRIKQERTVEHAVKRLESVGFAVSITRHEQAV